MLRRVGIRSKLMALVAAPMIVIIALSTLIVLQFRQETDAAQRQVIVTEGLPYLADLEGLLQQERLATSAYLVRPSPEGMGALKELRAKTDKAFLALRGNFGTASLGEVAPDAAITANALANNGFQALTTARQAIDAGKLSATGMRTIYNGLVTNVVGVPSLLAQSLGDPEIARELRAYQSVLQLAEYAVQERDLLTSMYIGRTVAREQLENHAALMGAQANAVTALGPLLRDDFPGQRTAVNAAIDAKSLDPFRADLAEAAQTGAMEGNVGAWNLLAGERIDKLMTSAKAVAAQTSSNADVRAADTRRTEYLVVAIAVAALAIVVLLTILVGRRITRPLLQLTEVARDMSTKLPTMVEQMQRPGDRPDLVVEPISVRSHDEVGKLAEAFNSVNEVTVRVAGEQAALRGSIAEMFTNMARRNQVLLDRQLAFLDRLEAREEDPDTLENLFRLDHLATRMRRNSESLLVLAGIDAARKLRQPMPLSDVIRAAIGGIEAYDRVDLQVTDDAMISGRIAMSLSHLFAELLENATHFSNPDTRVWVSASAVSDGLLVVVRDQGLGMTDDELAEANERIQNPPVTELAVAQRLGFFVVGRLAQRLGAKVHLAHGPRGGVVAEIELPAALFQGDAVPVSADTVAPVDGSPARPASVGTVAAPLGGALSEDTVTVVPTDDGALPTRARAGVPAETIPDATPIPMPRIDDTAPAPTLPTRSGAPAVPDVPPVDTPTVPVPSLQVPSFDLPPYEVPHESAPTVSMPRIDMPPAQRTPAHETVDTELPAADGPAYGRAAVEPEPVEAPAPPVAPPVAARTILPTRERGLLRRRAVETPPAPQFPRHAAPPVRPGAPMHAPAPSTMPSAAPVPAAAPVAMPVMPVEIAPAAPVALPARTARTEAPAAVPAAAPVPAPVPVVAPGPAPVEAVATELSPLAQLSQLASASYTPEVITAPEPLQLAVQAEPGPEPIGLARRQPPAKPVGAIDDAEEPTRQRAAGDVRSMLSGFRAGVQRGRDGAAHTTRPAHGVDNMRRD
jgi:signal transduction histidine kinase